jgi:NADPH2:quinone reductase
MRAAVLHAYATVPVVGEFADPVAEGEGQLALDVVAAGMNPVDRSIASGTFYAGAPALPYVVGREGVARLPGGGLAYFAGSIPPYGAFAERVLVDPVSLVPIPAGLDPAQAIAFGIAGLAGWLALAARAGLREGETVLVLGASGPVGQVAVQAARLLGARRVVAAARSEAGLAQAAAQGADAGVRLGADGWRAALHDAADGPGYDVVVDPLWGEPAAAALDAMAFAGRLVQLGQSAGATAVLPSAVIRGRMLEIIGHTNFGVDRTVQRAAFERMLAHGERGELSVTVERAGLDALPQIWEQQAASPHHKLIVEP